MEKDDRLYKRSIITFYSLFFFLDSWQVCYDHTRRDWDFEEVYRVIFSYVVLIVVVEE